MNNYKLFLDDVRIPKVCSKYMGLFGLRDPSIYLEEDWVIVKSYEEFCSTINEKGIPVLISFDHDLADEHYKSVINEENSDYDVYKEKTGYDCAKWLIEKCKEENSPIPDYVVHSMNIVGAENIKRILHEAII